MFFRTAALFCGISQKIGEQQSSKTLAAREQNTVNFPATLTAVCSVYCPSQSTCLFHYNVSPLHKATQPAMFTMLVMADCSNRQPRITNQPTNTTQQTAFWKASSHSDCGEVLHPLRNPNDHHLMHNSLTPPNLFTSCTTWCEVKRLRWKRERVSDSEKEKTITRNCTQCCVAGVFLPFVHVVKL